MILTRKAKLAERQGEATGRWTVRYDGLNSGLVEEPYETKQQARDRFFNVLAEKGGHFGGELRFIELRDPHGRLWFRDKFFEATDGKN